MYSFNMEMKTEFMKRIQSEMERLGIESLNELCTKAGMYRNTFARNANSEYFSSTKDIIKMANFFGRTLDWMVFGEDKYSKNKKIQELILHASNNDDEFLDILIGMAKGREKGLF